MHPSIIYNKRNVLFQRNTKKIIISEDIDKRCEKNQGKLGIFLGYTIFWRKISIFEPKNTIFETR